MIARILKNGRLILLGLAVQGDQCAWADFRGVTPDEVQALMERGIPVVDIRTSKEWQATGIIPGSHPLTFFDASGQYDTQRWLKNLKAFVPASDKPLVLVCRSGNRSSTVGKILTGELGFQQVFHLEKGIREWNAEGKPLTPAPCGNSC